jgi:hypothetical protein
MSGVDLCAAVIPSKKAHPGPSNFKRIIRLNFSTTLYSLSFPIPDRISNQHAVPVICPFPGSLLHPVMNKTAMRVSRLIHFPIMIFSPICDSRFLFILPQKSS